MAKREWKDMTGEEKASAFLGLIVVGLVVYGAIHMMSGPSKRGNDSADSFREVPILSVPTPEKTVVDEMIDRYRTVLVGGTYGDLCAQAGMVKAAMLQAHDQAGYSNWTQQEKTACDWSSRYGKFNRTVNPDLRDAALSNTKIKLCDWKGIPVESKRCKVTDEQVEKEHQDLMAELTRYLPKG